MISHTPHPDQVQPDRFAFSAENQEKVKAIIAKYPPGRQRSAVMPLLDLAQRQEGWLSRTAMDAIAAMLDLAPMRVYETASFYTMFKLRPVGKFHVQVCTNISCWLRGSDDVKRAAEEVFGVGFGQSGEEACLEEVECAGACANAPVAQIGDDYFEDLTYENAKALFLALKDGRPTTPGSQIGRCGSAPEDGSATLKGEG